MRAFQQQPPFLLLVALVLVAASTAVQAFVVPGPSGGSALRRPSSPLSAGSRSRTPNTMMGGWFGTQCGLLLDW